MRVGKGGTGEVFSGESGSIIRAHLEDAEATFFRGMVMKMIDRIKLTKQVQPNKQPKTVTTKINYSHVCIVFS